MEVVTQPSVSKKSMVESFTPNLLRIAESNRNIALSYTRDAIHFKILMITYLQIVNFGESYPE